MFLSTRDMLRNFACSLKYWRSLYLLLFSIFISNQILQAQSLLVGEPIELIQSDTIGFMNPKWSPSGEFIAISSSRYEGIWIASSDGDNLQQLTNETAGFGLSWSPNSTSIVSRVSYEEGRKRKLAVKIFSIAGLDDKLITDYVDQLPDLPVWDITGEYILIPVKRELQRIESGEQPQIAKQNSDNYTYLILNNELTRIEPNSNQTTISPFVNETYLNLSISPDRSKLAFEIYGGGLFILDTADLSVREVGLYHRASWSPNSRYLVAMDSKDDGYTFIESDLIVFDSETDRIQNITLKTDIIAMNPAWSPLDGGILFDSPETGIIYYLPIRYE